MANFMPGSVLETADNLFSQQQKGSTKAQEAGENVTVEARKKSDATSTMMEAVTWTSNKTVTVMDCPRPSITDDNDAIIRMTSSAICGSDLHLFRGNIPGMQSGSIMGHEAMGIVEEIGPGVRKVRKGDRIVASFCIACGNCYFCKLQLFSSCDMTNPTMAQEKMMGARTSGMLGYSTLTGGFAGGQSEYFRMPFADVNCLVLPPESELSDDRAVFLSDILPTAWHGCELASVGQDDVVAIWGAGPVGILAAHCAFARGARRVIVVDKVPYRLDFVKRMVKGVETVDFSSKDEAPEKQVSKLCQNEPGGGPDCIIECVGMHYAHSLLHRFEMAVGLETDSPEALNATLMAARKGGKIAAIGAYAGLANHFNLGALMEKGLTIASGQTPVQRYWHELLEKTRQGVLDPSIVLTHHMDLKDAAKAYQMFDEKTDDVIKVVLHPSSRVHASGK